MGRGHFVYCFKVSFYFEFERCSADEICLYFVVTDSIFVAVSCIR